MEWFGGLKKVKKKIEWNEMSRMSGENGDFSIKEHESGGDFFLVFTI